MSHHFFSDNIVEEGLQMMHHTKFLKRCLTQPRLLLQTFLLGMLVTGCFAVMAGFGTSMVSAQSLNVQKTPHPHRHHHYQKHKGGDDEGTENPGAKDDDKGNHGPGGAPDGKGTGGTPVVPSVVPAMQHNTTGTDTNAAGSKNASGAVPGFGAVPVGGIPVGGVPSGVPSGAPSGAPSGVPSGGSAGRPGLPYTGSDPGNNPLP